MSVDIKLFPLRDFRRKAMRGEFLDPFVVGETDCWHLRARNGQGKRVGILAHHRGSYDEKHWKLIQAVFVALIELSPHDGKMLELRLTPLTEETPLSQSA